MPEDTTDTSWPFGQEEEPSWSEPPARNWLRWPLLVGLALVVVLGSLLAYGLSQHPISLPGISKTSPSPSSSTPPTRVRVVAVDDLDPEATPPEENPDKVGNAIDADPATGWATVTYKRRPDLGGLKSGVGLVLDLGDITKVSRVRISFVGSPTSYSLYSAPTDSAKPTSITGLDLLSKRVANTETSTYRLKSGVRTRYLVVWLTSLPPAPGGFRGEITDVAVWS